MQRRAGKEVPDSRCRQSKGTFILFRLVEMNLKLVLKKKMVEEREGVSVMKSSARYKKVD